MKISQSQFTFLRYNGWACHTRIIRSNNLKGSKPTAEKLSQKVGIGNGKQKGSEVPNETCGVRIHRPFYWRWFERARNQTIAVAVRKLKGLLEITAK